MSGLLLALAGCVSAPERAQRSALDRAGETLAALPAAELGMDPGAVEVDVGELPAFDGRPGPYVAFALAHDRGLRAKWERWRAAIHRIARERRLPMPTLTYTAFVSTIETRVGPQRHRLGLRQRFPWPGALLAGADAASASARVEQRKFEAAALELRAEVVAAYWRLWLIRELATIKAEELELFEAVTELARGRMVTGASSLAEVQQLELRRARIADGLDGLREQERAAVAELLGRVAAPLDVEAPTRGDPPAIELPGEDAASLDAALADHPALGRWLAAAEASELRVKQARHARAPGLALGVDWIEVGPARTAGVDGSGRDALSVSVGVELPLWQRNYAEDQRAAEAEGAAARAEWAATHDRVAAQIRVVYSRLRDSARRVALHETTLIPQAETALESTLGGYATGDASLSAILLAERELLELRVTLGSLHAAHAQAWAELEALVGRPVDGGPP